MKLLIVQLGKLRIFLSWVSVVIQLQTILIQMIKKSRYLASKSTWWVKVGDSFMSWMKIKIRWLFCHSIRTFIPQTLLLQYFKSAISKTKKRVTTKKLKTNGNPSVCSYEIEYLNNGKLMLILWCWIFMPHQLTNDMSLSSALPQQKKIAFWIVTPCFGTEKI